MRVVVPLFLLTSALGCGRAESPPSAAEEPAAAVPAPALTPAAPPDPIKPPVTPAESGVRLTPFLLVGKGWKIESSRACLGGKGKLYTLAGGSGDTGVMVVVADRAERDGAFRQLAALPEAMDCKPHTPPGTPPDPATERWYGRRGRTFDIVRPDISAAMLVACVAECGDRVAVACADGTAPDDKLDEAVEAARRRMAEFVSSLRGPDGEAVRPPGGRAGEKKASPSPDRPILSPGLYPRPGEAGKKVVRSAEERDSARQLAGDVFKKISRQDFLRAFEDAELESHEEKIGFREYRVLKRKGLAVTKSFFAFFDDDLVATRHYVVDGKEACIENVRDIRSLLGQPDLTALTDQERKAGLITLNTWYFEEDGLVIRSGLVFTKESGFASFFETGNIRLLERHEARTK